LLSVKCYFRVKQIPLNPPFSKGEAEIPPLKKWEDEIRPLKKGEAEISPLEKVGS